jgi:hypothetical protein
MWLYNGKFITENKSWVDVNSIRHPPNWFVVWSDEDKISAGMVEVADPEIPSGIFYDFSRNEDGSYTSTERDLNLLKTQYIESTKQTANQLLALSDWQVIAKIERNRSIDESIVTYRSEVLTVCATIEGYINACDNLEEFKLLFNIPVDGVAPLHDWPELVE